MQYDDRQIDAELHSLMSEMSADPRIRLPKGDAKRSEDGSSLDVEIEFFSRSKVQAILARAGEFWSADAERRFSAMHLDLELNLERAKHRLYMGIYYAVVLFLLMGYWLYVAYSR